MTEQEAAAYIEEWDVTEAAKVLKWYEEDELLRPCDCDTIVAIETEDIRAENAKLREIVENMFYALLNVGGGRGKLTAGEVQNIMARMQELGIEVGE